VPIRKRGTVVRARPVRLTLARHRNVLTGPGQLGPWETACAEQGLGSRTDIAAVGRAPTEDDVAALLEIEPGTEAIRRLQHMYFGDHLAQLQETWIPLTIAEGTVLAAAEKITGGIYRALLQLGHQPSTAHETVQARMPQPHEAAVLQLNVGTPVLAIERITRDAAGSVLTLVRAIATGDRVQLSYDQELG
ncbi:MAG: GntR family transcriptional regulator, partial [Actinomycetota bacterium]|nr:GntR family transcriptional regulator [Actinomycetota bacterium]